MTIIFQMALFDWIIMLVRLKVMFQLKVEIGFVGFYGYFKEISISEFKWFVESNGLL